MRLTRSPNYPQLHLDGSGLFDPDRSSLTAKGRKEAGSFPIC